MVRVRIIREALTGQYTEGGLYIDSERFCDTLEDAVRNTKVPGKTAIPAGKYPLTLEYSPRFRRVLPTIVGVPGFSGIRIHAGNGVQDTSGCPLVGQRGPAGTLLYGSRQVEDRLVRRLRPLLQEAGEGLPAEIEVTEAGEGLRAAG